MIVVNHDCRLGVDIVAMCCYLSPVSRSPDVTVVDMLQAGGRGSGWIINTGGTLSPGHSGCVGGWPRLSSSLTDPQLAVPRLRSLSAHAVIVCYSRLLLPNCWPTRRVTSLAAVARQWRRADQSQGAARPADQSESSMGRRQPGRWVMSEPGRQGGFGDQCGLASLMPSVECWWQ